MKVLINPTFLFFLCIAVLASLIAISINLLGAYDQNPLIFYLYLALLIIVFFAAMICISLGIKVMRFNDKMMNRNFQEKYFMRLWVVLGVAVIVISIVELFSIESGYIPIAFAFGIGSLWSIYSLYKKQNKQDTELNSQ